MSANSIGSGCKMLAVSVPIDEPLVWRRLALDSSEGPESMARLVRRFLVSGLRAEAEAAAAAGDLQHASKLQSALKDITEIRRKYYGRNVANHEA